jgi:tRNA-specific 2-thiouridylase
MPKVLLGMSGGVDSSVSAVLLQEQGYDVIGGFMKNWSDGDDHQECGWRTERRDALRVASQLNIPFYTFDFEKEYRRLVYEYMINEYRRGRTPNPDVLCNKYMKFDLFLRMADTLGCDMIATGHYARAQRDDKGVLHLLAGRDPNKDQSYFLCQLQQSQLVRALFPVGDLLKSEVREIATQHNLPVADKKDSQGICFVGKVDMEDFLAARIPPHTGNIVDTEGNILGTHHGFEFYTIGQRDGLGVGGSKVPLYVVERRAETNEVVVARGDDHPALYRAEVTVRDVTETIPSNLLSHLTGRITARIRYRQPLSECTIKSLHPDGSLHVVFDAPQRAVAPGQFIAFYVEDELIGSGVICDGLPAGRGGRG